MILFLDIDGVLRREESPPYVMERELVQLFETTIRRLPQLRVVISSSWRDVLSLEQIRAHFSPDIRPRLIGVTPGVPRPMDDYCRHREVLAYLKAAGLGKERWVAIDDRPGEFLPGAPLVVTDSARGLDEVAVADLLVRVSGER